VTAMPGPELETIGYLVASNADAADGFGFAVATTADGAMLAIGAPYEDCTQGIGLTMNF
jgi:hypothetical protein